MHACVKSLSPSKTYNCTCATSLSDHNMHISLIVSSSLCCISPMSPTVCSRQSTLSLSSVCSHCRFSLSLCNYSSCLWKPAISLIVPDGSYPITPPIAYHIIISATKRSHSHLVTYPSSCSLATSTRNPSISAHMSIASSRTSSLSFFNLCFASNTRVAKAE